MVMHDAEPTNLKETEMKIIVKEALVGKENLTTEELAELAREIDARVQEEFQKLCKLFDIEDNA
jgi:hypothetical protein